MPAARVTAARPTPDEAELDRTSRDQTIRAIALTLRVIGDPRAVPDLLRALPKCPDVSSSFGLGCSNPDLVMWVQARIGRPEPTRARFTWPPAARQIAAALTEITRHSDALPVRWGMVDDAYRKLVAQDREAFVSRFTMWWQANKSTVITPDQEQSLTAGASDQEIEQAGLEVFGPLFPTDAAHRPGPVIEVFLPSQTTEQWDIGVYYSFLTGRFRGVSNDDAYPSWFIDHVNVYASTYLHALPATAPSKLVPPAKGGPSQARRDLGRAIMETKWDEANPLLRLEGNDVHTWEVDRSVWDKLDETFATATALAPGNKGPRADFIPYGPTTSRVDYDPKQLPLTFLFTTADGVHGILQVMSLVTHPKADEPLGINIRYRLMGQPPLVATTPTSQPAMGLASYGETRHVTLGDSLSDTPAAVNLLSAQVRAIPADIRAIPFSENLRAWMKQSSMHLVTRAFAAPDGPANGASKTGRIALVAVDQRKVAPVSNRAWDSLTPQQLAEILVRKQPSPEAFATMAPAYNKQPPLTFACETTDGHQGLVQIAAIDDQSRTLVLRWKMVELPKGTGNR